MEKPTVCLTDICNFQGGSQPPKEEWIDHAASGYIRMLQIRDFTQAEKDNVEYVKESKTLKKCNSDDILIGRYGASAGKILTGLSGAYNVAIIKTIPDEKKIFKPYLYFYLNSPYFQNYIAAVGSRAAQAGFNKEDLNSAVIPLPPLEEQRRIAALLDKVSDLIAKRREQLDKLDELVKARFVEMFGNFIFDRDRWEICKVGLVADTIDPQPSHRTPPVSTDGIPYIGIAECNYETWHIDFEKARKVGKNVLREHQERYTLDNGDFIIGKIGTIGKPFPIPAKQTYTLSANTILIKPIKNKVMPQFLFAVFQSEYMDRIIDAEKKSTSQPAFGIQKVRNIEMPLPPMKLQQGFSDFVEQLDKSKLTIQQSLDKLEVLKKALMQKYFG